MFDAAGAAQEYVLDLLAAAKDQLVEDGALSPMFIFGTGATVVGFPARWSTEAEEQRVLTFARSVACAYNVSSVAFVAEAWMTRPGALENDVGRVRGVTVVFQWRAENGGIRVIEEFRRIKRGPDGRPVGLSPATVESVPFYFRGQLPNILPPKPVPERVQKSIRRALSALGCELKFQPLESVH